ncbi:TolC family protein [Flavobacterium beibuense]|uniref:TolC family protein n=1 Tax=Flavobacterium beibuense TaxID=657326 RepID=UPI003A951B35
MIAFIKKITLRFLPILISLPLFSQEPQSTTPIYLSIEDTWNKAINYSKKIELSRMEATISEGEIAEKKIERLPEMDLKGNYEYATNIPVYENGLFSKPTQHEVIHILYKVSAGYYFNIYNGNKLNLAIKSKEIAAELANEQRDLSISEIKLQAAAYYLDLQRSYIFKKLVIDDIANQEEQLSEIVSLSKNGVVLESDVLRVKLKLSNQKMMLVKIDNDIAITNQKLNIVIGLPDHQLIQPDSLKDPALISLTDYEDWLKIAEHNSYDYNISSSKTELSRIALKSVKANVRPKIGLYGEFYLANPQIFLYPYSPSNYTLGVFGVRASFPLSELYLNKPKERVAKLNLEREELEHHHVEDKIREDVFAAFTRYNEALVRINVAKDDVEQSEENARIISENYFHQSVLITDLLDANIQLLQSQFNLASAKIAAQIQYYQLQHVTGTL